MKRTSKIAKWCCGVLCGVLLLLLVGGLWMFGQEIQAAYSIIKLENGLYSMEYSGDYGLDAFLAQGGAADDSAVADYLVSFLSQGFYRVKTNLTTEEAGCSAFCTETADGRVLFGRNYDWSECSAMLVHTKPDHGYSSVSTCCLDFLGFGEGYTPDASLMKRLQALAAVYVPLDGMNEKGFMVADLMAGDHEETHQRTGKTPLTTTTMIRLLLDRAADVEEAISLLERYDMNSSMGSAHHLFLADASGRSAVVEYVNGEMLVTEAKVVTNHYLSDCGKQGLGSEQSHIRYDTLSAFGAPKDEANVRDMLEAVSQKNYPQNEDSYEKTMWSIVYSPDALCADFYFSENYSHSYGLVLLEKGGFLKR